MVKSNERRLRLISRGVAAIVSIACFLLAFWEALVIDRPALSSVLGGLICYTALFAGIVCIPHRLLSVFGIGGLLSASCLLTLGIEYTIHNATPFYGLCYIVVALFIGWVVLFGSSYPNLKSSQD